MVQLYGATIANKPDSGRGARAACQEHFLRELFTVVPMALFDFESGSLWFLASEGYGGFGL